MFKKILVVSEDHAFSQCAIHEAISWARGHRGSLFFLHVPQSTSPAVPLVDAASRAGTDEYKEPVGAEATAALLDAQKLAEDHGVLSYGLATAAGSDAVQCIVAAVARHRCDVIVVGKQPGNAVQRLLRGSVIPGLITHAPVPVLICSSTSTNPLVQSVGDSKRALRAKALRMELYAQRRQEDND